MQSAAHHISAWCSSIQPCKSPASPWLSPSLNLWSGMVWGRQSARQRGRFLLMSLRLARRIRVQAGWLIALAYLFCVASPGLALALGSGPAPCFTEEMALVASASVQDDQVPMMHMDGDKASHHHMHEAHDHAGVGDDTAGHHHKHSSLPGPCCAMMCVSAIPADLPAIVAPSRPMSLCVFEADRGAPDNAPPLLYRPPIA
jgi:hypothetical protein